MIKRNILILLSIFFLVTGCNQTESKFTQATKALGVEISQPSDFDISNIDHLVFLHQHATEQDKQTAQDMMRAAYDAIMMEPGTSPLIQYSEALMNYPTVASLLGIANGYLRTADRSLIMASGNFTKTDNSGNPTAKYYNDYQATSANSINLAGIGGVRTATYSSLSTSWFSSNRRLKR